MSRPADQHQSEDQQLWHPSIDRDAHQERLTQELTAAYASVLETAEDW